MHHLLHVLSAACAACAISTAAAGTTADCHVGAYRLSDETVIAISPSRDNTLRWLEFDGTTGALQKMKSGEWTNTIGWTDRLDARSALFPDCAADSITFGGIVGHRIEFDVKETVFEGHDVDLAGRLVLPKGGTAIPIVVLLHGAENTSARDTYALQSLLPAKGVGVFVYDKRGTGASGGQYTQDFDLLADDAVAAMREAKRMAGSRGGRIGYHAESQGGAVAPLAATRALVDFVIVSSGLAVSLVEADQQAIALEMGLKGHSAAEIACALEVASAAEDVIASRFTAGFERFNTLRSRYGAEPWYRDLHGSLTYLLLPHSEAELREMGKAPDFGTSPRYDPMPTLRAVNARQLWILGEDDSSAPSAATSSRLKQLIANGRPITVALYPHVEHGMTEFETNPDGERVPTRYAPGYFAMLRDFAAKGRLHGPYGPSVVILQRGQN